MAGRNLGHNAASHDFIRDFTPRPLADRAILWLFTGQRHHLAGLLRRDLRPTARAGLIRESLADRQIFSCDPLQRQPASPPATHRIHTHSLLPRDLAIILSRIGCQNDAPA